ncbi:MAG TPA: cytochrome C oxidase subunit IV family protein [Acidimicrobiales bacterium]|nr:cytochrome C oxidase subunit IV family protein [Acidimicrobiales bacterium]
MTATTEHEHPAEGMVEHADHPTEGQYWKIFFILFAVTAIEVVLYYFELPGSVHINHAALGILAIGKFIIVVAYFMHLKFDNKILRRLFVTGLVLAVLVYVAYLLTMGVFIDPPSERQGSFSR